MNHSWKDNKCVRCGLERGKKERTTYGMPYSRLGRDGVWHDVTPIRSINHEFAYWINGKWTFERPDCKIGFISAGTVGDNSVPSENPAEK